MDWRTDFWQLPELSLCRIRPEESCTRVFSGRQKWEFWNLKIVEVLEDTKKTVFDFKKFQFLEFVKKKNVFTVILNENYLMEIKKKNFFHNELFEIFEKIPFCRNLS